MTSQEIIEQLQKAIVEGESEKTGPLASAALESGLTAAETIQAASEGMKTSGELFEQKDYFVADLIASAEAMKAVVRVLEPHLAGSNVLRKGRILLGTVQGDVHDIGKNLVAIVLRTAGFEVYDLGTNVRAEVFADKAAELNVDIVGSSAYTSTALGYQRDILTELVKRGLKDRILYMVGGAPTNAEWAKSIGADGWGEDAWQAAKVATQLIQRKRS